MIEGFQNPGLAIGAALCVVPLIIHLLNRQRHRPQPWAAMRFVLAAYKKTRRQVQLENLILLLLRMLAVAALAFAIARPFASGDSPLAALREERRDLILVIDSSASTGYRQEVETVYERIVGRAAELIEELDESRGDRVKVVVAGSTPRAFPMTGPVDAASILETLETPLDESANLAAAFGDVAAAISDDIASGVSSAVDVRLLTDLQAAAFSAAVGTRRSDDASSAQGTDEPSTAEPLALAEELEVLDSLGVKVVVEDFGPRAMRPANLSIQSLSLLGEVPRAGVPFEVAVSVANHGDKDLLAERVALEVGGERLPSQRIDIPARGSAEAVFTAEVAEPGHHALTASLEGDRLGVDDERSIVLDLPKPLRVLVVNGAPAERLEDDEIGYLLAVLEPPDDSLGGAAPSPFEVEIAEPADLDGAETGPGGGVEGADVIVLANVPTLTSRSVERIESRVRAGAGLLVTLGDRAADLSSWKASLERDDGTGLLPAELQRRVAAARRTSYYRVTEFDETYPGLEYFTDEKRRPLLTEVPFYEFISAIPLEGARVLARFDDTAGSPFLIERPYGSGSVVLWTSTIDHAWNRVPDSGKTFVPLVLELLQNLRLAPESSRSVSVGDDVTLVLDDFPRGASLVKPSGGQQPIEGDAIERADQRWQLPLLPGAYFDEVGVFEVRAEGLRAEPIAVQFDARESDLARATPAEIESIHPALVVAEPTADGKAQAAPGQPRRGEIWRWLAMAALAFLVLESLFGAYIGRRRGAVS
ncbi:MAG: BatA domain-containing protein [Planctomycetota bacterium]